MSGDAQHHHRSTLKQKHKSFKSRHASKGSLKQAAKGRQDSGTSKASSHKSSPLSSQNAVGSSLIRRNHAKQLQLQKRAALVQANRLFRNGLDSSGVDGTISGNTGLVKGLTSSKAGGAPRIVVVCTLTQDISSWDAVQEMEDEGEDGGVKPVPGRCTKDALTRGIPFVELDLIRFKTTLQLHPIPYGALYPLLDACKAADFVLLLLSSTSSIESGSWGELAMRTLQAQGMPTVMAATPTFNTAAEGSKRSKAVTEIRKSLLSFTQYFAPEVEKVYSLEEDSERSALLRVMATSTPRRVAWRDFRAWIVSEEAEWEPSSNMNTGTLKIKGWARGAPLSANRLIHIPDFGDFAVEKITLASTHRARNRQDRAVDVEMTATDTEDVLDEHNDELADDLQSENSVNDLENEQTWPTQEEMNGAHIGSNGMAHAIDLPPALPGTTPKNITKDKSKRKDMRYDANWIKELDDFDDAVEIEQSEAYKEEDGQSTSMHSIDEGGLEQELPGGVSEYAEDYDDEEELRELAEYKAKTGKERARRKEESQYVEFPDEVDTPLEIPARVRFARYRGLKSFRTSPWDPYEDLPADYARIFQFDDFKKTRRRVEASALEEGVQPGMRICLWIKNVPKEAAIRARAVHSDVVLAPADRRVPFVVFGLLRHEHKKSVLNFTVTRNTEYEGTVRSKDPLILCLGPRRFRVNPIFSQHDIGNNGKNGSNNVHKLEKYLRGGTGVVSIATVFGPVTFGGSNVSAMLLKERREDGENGYDQRGVGATQMPILAGMGSLLDADPTRIVAKRIVLTGHPYKVHKKTSTIRFMFFNPEDVRYYAPLELRTKYGRVGHIQESLGTHGYFKAHFDGPPLSQIDTVSLPLYKRSYPRFSQLYKDSQGEMPRRIAIGQEEANIDDIEML